MTDGIHLSVEMLVESHYQYDIRGPEIAVSYPSRDYAIRKKAYGLVRKAGNFLEG